MQKNVSNTSKVGVPATWGVDPYADLSRLVQNITRGGIFAQHPRLIPPIQELDLSRLDSVEDSVENSVKVHSAITKSSTLEILKRLVPQIDKPLKLPKNLLVLQIDDLDSSVYDSAPPPANYYRYVIETRYWRKVWLVNLGSDTNGVTELLKTKYPKLTIFSGSIEDKLRLLATAPECVMGAHPIMPLLAQINAVQRRLWVPAESINAFNDCDHKLMPIGFKSYFDKQAWQGRRADLEELLNTKPEQISDLGRWEFTETERCRSFEFCKSCRDTGTTGVLWRRAIAQRFDVPNESWECPHGWLWGGKPGMKLKFLRFFKIGSAIKKTTTALGVKPCTDCYRRGQRWDGKSA